MTLTLVSEETADPISGVAQAESLKSLTVFPLTTPPTLIVGVGSRPGELPGVTKDKDDGAEGAVVTTTPPPLESPPLQEARSMRVQKTEGDFQPQELNTENDRMTE